MDRILERSKYLMQFGHWEGDSLVSRKSVVSLNSLISLNPTKIHIGIIYTFFSELRGERGFRGDGSPFLWGGNNYITL